MNGRIFTQQLFASRAAAKDQSNSFRVSCVEWQVRGIAAGVLSYWAYFSHTLITKNTIH